MSRDYQRRAGLDRRPASFHQRHAGIGFHAIVLPDRLPLALAVVGGNPERFRPDVDVVRDLQSLGKPLAFAQQEIKTIIGS
ncbi:MAG TPA: hypothetical protein VK862_06390 [Afifellaceae bacterium]|nr:hypothetical protein [Afifellaceae bacterium]